jgi:hypothetical protein
MRTGNTGASGADVQSLGEFNELGTGSVGGANEDRNLDADTAGAPASVRIDERVHLNALIES